MMVGNDGQMSGLSECVFGDDGYMAVLHCYGGYGCGCGVIAVMVTI